MIRNKTIKFNLDKEEERELWEWLQSRPHGEFSTITKQFWRLSKDRGSKLHQVMHDEFWENARKRTEH